MANFLKWPRAGCVGLVIGSLAPWYAQADSVREWEKQIFDRLASQRRFPPEARGQSGAAKVAFTIDRSGNLISEKLVQSTGSPLLDAEAIAMVKRAQPFPAPPPEVGEDRPKFELPIVFDSPPRGTAIDGAIFKGENDAVNAKTRGICRGC
jgi:periplasmic protein TonB